jgi:hypothetical protein
MSEPVKPKDISKIPPNDLTLCEQRSGEDRRIRRVPTLRYIFFPGRRQKPRRREDAQRFFFFDRYSTKLFVAIVVILFLSIFDALLTLYLIGVGSSEINPIMAFFLKFGPLIFMAAKYFLTSLGVVILLIFKNAFLVRPNIYIRSLFSYLIAVFSIVIAWELFLIFLGGF